MALEMQFGLEEYAGAFAAAPGGALAISSGRQGRAYIVDGAKIVDAAATGTGDGLVANAGALEPDDVNTITHTVPLSNGAIVLADDTGLVRLYANKDEGEGRELVKANDLAPSSLRASADGSKLALCRNGKVLVIDVKSGDAITLEDAGTDSAFDPLSKEKLAVVDISSKQLALYEVSVGEGVDDSTLKSRCSLHIEKSLSQTMLEDDNPLFQCAWQPGSGEWLAAPGRPELTLLKRDPADMDWGKSAQGVFPDEDQKSLFAGSPGHHATVVACAWNSAGTLVATITDQLTTNVAAVWDVATGSTLKVFACDIRIQSLALCSFGKGEALVLASKHGALATALVLEPEVETNPFVEDEVTESPQKRSLEEDGVPVVSKRKKKRVVESDEESVDLSLSPKAENEPAPEDDEIIGDEQLDGDQDPFALVPDEAFAAPDEESVVEAPQVTSPVIPCQRSFMPSATIEQEEGAPRYLHWSQRGCVTARAEEGGLEFAFEVEHFAEGLARTKTTRFVDRRDFTVAALGKSGAIFASEGQEDNENAPSILHFRPLDAWARDAGWSATLPPGERVQVVAAGDDFVAACTSRDLIRIYSTGGVEDAVVASLGPVVACAAHGRYLAVAYHGGNPDSEGRQHIQVQVLDVENRSALNGNGTRLPLQPGTLLTWLAFKSDDGVLLAADSQGSFWLLVDDFGHRWAPALDTATTRHNIGDREWPVYAKHGSVHCCVLKGGLTQPQCRGARPVLDALPLRLPHASSARDAAQRRAEAGLGAPTTLARQRARLAGSSVLAFTRRPASDDAAKHERTARDLARAANEAVLQRDRAVLRQLVAATKDGAYARAYDLARRLQLRESLDLARRIAASHGEDALTARVEDLIAVADEFVSGEDAADEENVAPEAAKVE